MTSTDFTRLAPLAALCTLSSLLPLPLLGLVPDVSGDEEEGREGDGKVN